MTKKHYRHKEKEGPACGSNPTFYGPIEIVADENQVNCERCQITIKRLEKEREAKAPGAEWTREFLAGEG